MALPIPFRRRSKLATAAEAARRVAVARAGFALFETSLKRRLPVPRRKQRKLTPARAAIAGGTVAAIAGLVRSRRSGGGDGGGGSSVYGGPPPVTPSTPAPGPSNVDVPGPPANPATPIPAPDTSVVGGVGIDEEAEVTAAAAEAAAIGGVDPAYSPSVIGEELDPAEIPLAEAGGGVSEGQEQAEGDLEDLVTTNIGPGGGMTDSERLIEETIERQSNPQDGETIDPAAPPRGEER